MGKRLFPTFVKYVSQSVMGMVGISCYILADTWFVSAAFGAEGLAALNLAIVVYSLMNAAGLMAGIGGATLFLLSFAAGRERRTEIFSSTAALCLFFAVIFTGAGLFFSGGIARLLGADEVIFAMTRSYLRTILSFSLFFIMNNIFLAFVRNDGSPRLAMAAMVTGSLSNIALDYLFIFPFGWGALRRGPCHCDRSDDQPRAALSAFCPAAELLPTLPAAAARRSGREDDPFGALFDGDGAIFRRRARGL